MGGTAPYVLPWKLMIFNALHDEFSHVSKCFEQHSVASYGRMDEGCVWMHRNSPPRTRTILPLAASWLVCCCRYYLVLLCQSRCCLYNCDDEPIRAPFQSKWSLIGTTIGVLVHPSHQRMEEKHHSFIVVHFISSTPCPLVILLPNVVVIFSLLWLF